MTPTPPATTASEVHATINLLIDKLVSLQDRDGAYIYKLPNGGTLDTKSWNDGWDWTHGVGLYGIWKYYELTGRPELLQTIRDWFAHKFSSTGSTEKNINTMSVFLTLAYVYEETGDRTYRPWLEAWAEWAMHDLPRTEYDAMQHITYVADNDQQLWDDTLMMTALPLCKIGLLLHRPDYVEQALRQTLVQIQYLFDRTTGLFFHGWQFADPAAAAATATPAPADGAAVVTGHNFADARWARGNSWLTIVLPELLELLEDDDDRQAKNESASSTSPAMLALRGYLLNTLEAQCRALVPLQEPDSGLWRTLLDHPAAEGSYPEASATAGFAYGILKARRKRYLAEVPGGNSRRGQARMTTTSHNKTRTYDEVARAAIQAVLDNVSPEGELLQTSFGTGMGNTLQFYKDIAKTAMPYGQAMAIMALAEYARTFY